jgi:transcription factor TFIIIB component B''
MSTLCADTGHGHRSSKFKEITQNFQKHKKLTREASNRQSEINEAKKYGRDATSKPSRGSDAPQSPGASAHAAPAESAVGSQATGPVNGSVDGPPHETAALDHNSTTGTSQANAQIRLGADGQIVVDVATLVYDRSDEQGTAHYTEIEESDTTKFVNSSSFGRKSKGSRWSAEATELFFNVCSW